MAGKIKMVRPIAVATSSILLGGAAFSHFEHVSLGTGFYWALTTAETVGYGDVIPKDPTGRVIASLVMATAIPAVGALFAHLTAWHLHKRNLPHLAEIKERADKAQRIVADLYEKIAEERHPDHPVDGTGSEG